MHAAPVRNTALILQRFYAVGWATGRASGPGAAEPIRQGLVNSVTFKSDMEKRRFSVPRLMTWCHQIDLPKSKLNTELLYIFSCTGRQKCTKFTDLTYTFKIFARVIPPDPITGREQAPPQTAPSLGARPPSHFFRSSADLACKRSATTIPRSLLLGPA